MNYGTIHLIIGSIVILSFILFLISPSTPTTTTTTTTTPTTTTTTPSSSKFPITESILDSKSQTNENYSPSTEPKDERPIDIFPTNEKEFLTFDMLLNPDRFKIYKKIHANIFNVEENEEKTKEFIAKLFKKFSDNYNKPVGKYNDNSDYKLEWLYAPQMIILLLLKSNNIEDNKIKDIFSAIAIDHIKNSEASKCIIINNDKTFRILSNKVNKRCGFELQNKNFIDKVDKDLSLEEIVNLYYEETIKQFIRIKTLNADFIQL